MPKLQCDICGGSIVMQPGGQLAVCDSCGMEYSTGRIREKVQEITGTVRIEGPVQARQTGTEDDVTQWKNLLDKYYKAGDFQAAENIVKKILEAVPSDEQANKMYDELQVLKFIEIKNGVLVSYKGQAESLVIPSCVEKIGNGAFKENNSLKEVTIPPGVIEIENDAFKHCAKLESVSIPDSVQTIGFGAFRECYSLSSITIPASVTTIESCVFEGCYSLSSITIPESVTSIKSGAFRFCRSLSSATIPTSVTHIGPEVFANCSSLTHVDLPEIFCRDSLFDGSTYLFVDSIDHDNRRVSPGSTSPWYIEKYERYWQERKRQRWRERGVCQYCGGSFSGLFSIKCRECGKSKDY